MTNRRRDTRMMPSRTEIGMQDQFTKYPDLEIFADALDPVYKVKYTECVEENGIIRFVRHQKRLPRESIESLLAEIVNRAESNA